MKKETSKKIEKSFHFITEFPTQLINSLTLYNLTDNFPNAGLIKRCGITLFTLEVINKNVLSTRNSKKEKLKTDLNKEKVITVPEPQSSQGDHLNPTYAIKRIIIHLFK